MISGYYWEKGAGQAPSLLLQQIRIGNKRVLLACICEGKGKEWEERLLLWFLKKLPERIRKKIPLEQMAEELRSMLLTWEKEPSEGESRVFGVVFCQQEYISFERGDIYCGWLYQRLGRWSMKKLSKNTKEWKVEYGRAQKGGRILLCNEEYLEGITEDTILEVLGEQGRWTKERICKYLKELRGVNKNIAQKGVGAIYVHI